MTTAPRHPFHIQSQDSSEELSKEENGLLARNDERSMSPTIEKVPWGKAVQIFVLGFLASLTILLIAWLIFTSSDQSVTETGSSEAAPLLGPITEPLFLNDTDAYMFLLDPNGGFEYSGHYFLLQQGFEAQVNQAYCGVATATTVLNSFRNEIDLPVDYEYDPYPYATQQDIFEDCVTNKVVYYTDEFDGILAAPYGLGMGQITALLNCFFSDQAKWRVKATHLDPSKVSLDQMRNEFIELLRDKNSRILVNFRRSVIHEEGGGHWSPLASYSPIIDAFLILDVAKYKYPPTWVPARTLYQAMATRDDCGNWRFPAGQAELSEDLLYPETSRSYNQAITELGCVKTYRGFLSVRRMQSS